MPDRYLGRHIGKYRVIRLLGGGAFAWVYEAIDQDLEIPVALKILRPEFSGDTTAEARFRREASTAAKLRHRNIVVVRDVGQIDGASFVAMDLLSGSVGQRLRNARSLPEEDVVRLGIDVAAALGVAHAAGIIHRDIKPDNLLIGSAGEAVVADFGLARALAQEAGLSATNQVMGTPHYFSPEQARGLELDGRSDLYSLGVTLFRCATGVLPFDGDDWYAVGRQHIDAPVPSARTIVPTLSAPFDQLLSRLLAKQPADRYPTAEALGEALRALGSASPDREPTPLADTESTGGPFLPLPAGAPGHVAVSKWLEGSTAPGGDALAAISARRLSPATTVGIAALLLVGAIGLLRVTNPGSLPPILGGTSGSAAPRVDPQAQALAQAHIRDSLASDSAQRDVLQDSLFDLALDSAAATPGLAPAPKPVAGVAPAAPATGGSPSRTPSTTPSNIALLASRAHVVINTADRATLYVDGQRVGQGSWSGDRPAGKTVDVRAALDDAPVDCETAQRDSTLRLKAGTRTTVSLPVRGCVVLKVDVDAAQSDARLVFTPTDGGITLRVRADSASGRLLVRGKYALVASLARCYEYRDTVTARAMSPDTMFLRFRMDCRAGI